MYRVLVGKPEGKGPLGRTRCRLHNNKTDLQEVGCEGMDWIRHAQDTEMWCVLANVVMNLRAQ